MKKKTILEWLSKIKDEGIKAEAVCNFNDELSLIQHPQFSLADAILYGFHWDSSPQGDSFWGEIYTKVQAGEEI